MLVTADLNEDGKPDLILANLSANHVTVLLGNGDGTFPTSKSYAAGAEPICVAVADFNGDGHRTSSPPTMRSTAPSRCCWAMATVACRQLRCIARDISQHPSP